MCAVTSDPASDPASDNATFSPGKAADDRCPTVTVGGVLVKMYVLSGALRVHVDTSDADPAIYRISGDGELAAYVSVNGADLLDTRKEVAS